MGIYGRDWGLMDRTDRGDIGFDISGLEWMAEDAEQNRNIENGMSFKAICY